MLGARSLLFVANYVILINVILSSINVNLKKNRKTNKIYINIAEKM